MNSPYVISGELELSSVVSLGRLDEFRTGLSSELEGMGKQVEWVSTAEMRTGLSQLVGATALPIISLDNRYVDQNKADASISISRSVSDALVDAGYDSRIGANRSVNSQLDDVADKLSGKEVCLVDDVLFSGEMMLWLCRLLSQRGVEVAAVIAGIGIGEGYEKLAAEGIDVGMVRQFANVEDEICERDFALVPGSGRKIFGKNLASLYFDYLYGRPTEWASLTGTDIREFTVSSLERTLRLLKPGLAMSSLGKFLGYDQDGLAKNSIINRINEAGI